MAIKSKVFVVRSNDRTQINEFLENLNNAENARIAESTNRGVTTVTITWNDTTAPSTSDISITKEADEQGLYYVSDIETDGMEYDTENDKYEATLKVKRKAMPTLSVEQNDNADLTTEAVTLVRKKNSNGIEAISKPIDKTVRVDGVSIIGDGMNTPLSSTAALPSSDDDTLQGDGSATNKLRLKKIYTDGITLEGTGISGDTLAIKSHTNTNIAIYTDSTLTGNGYSGSPLSVVGSSITGQNNTGSSLNAGDVCEIYGYGGAGYTVRVPTADNKQPGILLIAQETIPAGSSGNFKNIFDDELEIEVDDTGGSYGENYGTESGYTRLKRGNTGFLKLRTGGSGKLWMRPFRSGVKNSTHTIFTCYEETPPAAGTIYDYFIGIKVNGITIYGQSDLYRNLSPPPISSYLYAHGDVVEIQFYPGYLDPGWSMGDHWSHVNDWIGFNYNHSDPCSHVNSYSFGWVPFGTVDESNYWYAGGRNRSLEGAITIYYD